MNTDNLPEISLSDDEGKTWITKTLYPAKVEGDSIVLKKIKLYTAEDMSVALGAGFLACKMGLPLDDKEWISNYNQINNIL